MSDRKNYKFSVTVKTDDLAVVNCLRALSQYSQKTGNKRIPWGGTKNSDWKRDGCKITFRFSDPNFRKGFLDEIRRLLPTTLWKEDRRSDNDPAKLV